jgi:hypothetical protein
MLKGHNLVFVGLPPSLLLRIHQEDVMLIIISLLKREEEEEEKGDLIQGNLGVQSLVESSIATPDQSSILLLPSTCAPGQVSVGRKEEESSRNAVAESTSLLHRPRSPSHRRLPPSRLLSRDRYYPRLFLKRTNAQAKNPAHAIPTATTTTTTREKE